jgi:hypothetical protein
VSNKYQSELPTLFQYKCREKWNKRDWKAKFSLQQLSARQFMEDSYDSLMIDLDNGKSVAGNTKKFLERIVGFSEKINLPIQLVYYPPYHSKYNMIERFWAAVENYWSPLVLYTIENTIKIAKRVAWKGMNPIVHFVAQFYPKGVTVDSEDFKELQNYITRKSDLEKWDVLIKPH